MKITNNDNIVKQSRVDSESGTVPNFVLFLADDLGYGDLSFTGHPTIKNKHLDRMKSEGMELRDFYTSASVCTPSRSSLMTGRLPIRNGAWSNFHCTSTGGLPQSEITIARMLKNVGYSTFHVGKWHLGHYGDHHPLNHGFDGYYGVPYSVDMGCVKGCVNPDYPVCEEQLCPSFYSTCPPIPLMNNYFIEQQPANLSTLTMKYVDQAIKFIQRSVTAKRPFFLYFAFSHVHVAAHHPSSLQWAGKHFSGGSKRGGFGDAIGEMDWAVGKVMDALSEFHLSDDTFTIFTSDNGPWLCQGKDGGSSGLFRGGKRSVWEGGIRVPSLVHWPGVIRANSRSSELASTLDLLPTYAHLAKAPLPANRIIDGVNMFPILSETGQSNQDFLFFYNTMRNGDQRNHTVFAIRHGDFKLHYITSNSCGKPDPIIQRPPLLFQIKEDPSEKYPLDPRQYPKVVDTFDKALALHYSLLQPAHEKQNPDPDAILCCDRSQECQCG